MHGTERVEARTDQGFHRPRVGNLGGDEACLAPAARGQPSGLVAALLVDVRADHPRSGMGERQRDRRPSHLPLP